MGILGQIIEIFGQIIGFLFAYYLLRLAYKLYGKNRISGAVLVAWASVFIMLCSFQWFQVWAKSFIATNVTTKLTAFGQQMNSVQATTTEMHSQLAGFQTEIDKYQKELDEAQSKIWDIETNANTVQTTTTEMHNQLASFQTEIGKHQEQLDEVQGNIRDAETNVFNQQSVITNQFQQIYTVQSGLAAAETNLSAQEKRLSDLEHWVKQLFGKMTNETSTIQGTNN
jgi:chromosome segregation ATPase